MVQKCLRTATEYANTVAVDTNGNVFVAGVYNSPNITFGTTTLTNVGGYDMFFVKYSDVGDLLWAKSVNNTNDVFPEGMEVDSNGNLHMMGYFNSSSVTFGTSVLNNAASGAYSYFITKFDPSGNLLWAVRPNGSSTNVGGGNLAIDTSGNIFIIGRFTSVNMIIGSTTLTNAGGQDIFTARYNADGTASWAKTIGSSGDDYSADIALGPNGNCHVAGNFLSDSLTFGTTVLTNQGNDSTFTEYFLTKLDNTNLSVDQMTLNTINIQLYPNPVHRQFELSTVAPIQKVEVYSMLGQLVKSFNQQNQYDVSDLKKGSYIVKVSAEDSSESKIILID